MASWCISVHFHQKFTPTRPLAPLAPWPALAPPPTPNKTIQKCLNIRVSCSANTALAGAVKEDEERSSLFAIFKLLARFCHAIWLRKNVTKFFVYSLFCSIRPRERVLIFFFEVMWVFSLFLLCICVFCVHVGIFRAPVDLTPRV